jgi:hypothetical protein
MATTARLEARVVGALYEATWGILNRPQIMPQHPTATVGRIIVRAFTGLCFLAVTEQLTAGDRPFAALTGAATPTPTPCVNRRWEMSVPVPYPARGIFAVSDGTFVYAGGGLEGAFSNADLLRFDPASNSWTGLASSPDSHFLSQAVYHNGKIYNIGGFTGDAFSGFELTNTTRIYTTATDTWATGAPLPVPLTDHATALWNGTIYVAGGFGENGPVNTLYAYNIASNSWTTLAAMPGALYLPGFGVIDGKLYIASGNDDNVELDTLYIYDIATNTWSTGALVPQPVTGPGSAVLDGKLYLFGGGYPTALNITQIYDPVADTWEPNGPPLNVSRRWLYGTAVGHSILALGGYFDPYNLDANEQLTIAPCPCPGDQYTITPGTDTIVPGTDDAGNHCDQCDTLVTLPFPFQLYSETFTAVSVNSNGRLDFLTANEPGGFASSCLPAPRGPNGQYDFTIFALWHHLMTFTDSIGCSNWANGCGIFTSVSGTAPNRIFNIEFHTVRFANNSQAQQFEVRLNENSPNRRFDILYGTINGVTALDSAGIQGELGYFTEDFCDTVVPQNVSRTYTLEGCASPTPTPTPTVTPTTTVTPTPTALPRLTPTPRPRPAPRPRPTPPR